MAKGSVGLEPSEEEERSDYGTLEDSDLIVLDSIDENDEIETNNSTEVTSAKDAESKLLKQLEGLKSENALLKQQLHHLKKKREKKSSPIEVIFHNKMLAKRYKREVEQFMQNLIERFQKETGISKEDMEQKHESIQLEIYQSFCVDSTNLSHDHNDPETWRAPLYEPTYEEVLDKSSNENSTKIDQESPKKHSGSCFNCLGDHMVGDCPKKLDTSRIKKNRTKFAKSVVKSNRYHVEEKLNNAFRPGFISKNLRSALDLRPEQLPPYIYRMRILGYPPGWMKEAEIESSGLTMYDSEGKAIADNDTEDGEIDVNTIRVQFDPKKLVDYPGFNVYPPPGTLDETDTYQAPPLQPHHMRTFVEKTMKPPDPRPYRKRKLPSTFEEKAKKAKLKREEEDMDVEDILDATILDSSQDDDDDGCKFIPPLPPDSPTHSGSQQPPPPPPPPPPECNWKDQPNNESAQQYNSSATSSRSSSPSLTDLEEAKMKLMKELEQVGDISNTEDSSQQDSTLPDTGTQTDSASCVSDTESPAQNDKKPRRSKQVVRHHHHSLSVTVAPGTPVVLTHSGVSKLPDREKFSQGITDHLPFENLPNSTGTYDKMRHVLYLIRKKVQDNQ